MLLQPSSYKFNACMYMVCFCTLVSNIWGQKFFLWPLTFKITFEIDWPPGQWLQKLIMEAWYSKHNEAGLNLSAKDLTNKVCISITNNDTVRSMWYTMHIFYI